MEQNSVITQKAEHLIPIVARQMALRNPVDLLRSIYRVPVRWVGEIFRMESSIMCVTNGRQLEDALNKEEVTSIFVPKGAGLNLELIQTIVDRSAFKKNIYVENI